MSHKRKNLIEIDPIKKLTRQQLLTLAIILFQLLMIAANRMVKYATQYGGVDRKFFFEIYFVPPDVIFMICVSLATMFATFPESGKWKIFLLLAPILPGIGYIVTGCFNFDDVNITKISGYIFTGCTVVFLVVFAIDWILQRRYYDKLVEQKNIYNDVDMNNSSREN